jgi:hypothetical protein
MAGFLLRIYKIYVKEGPLSPGTIQLLSGPLVAIDPEMPTLPSPATLQA